MKKKGKTGCEVKFGGQRIRPFSVTEKSMHRKSIKRKEGRQLKRKLFALVFSFLQPRHTQLLTTAEIFVAVKVQHIKLFIRYRYKT